MTNRNTPAAHLETFEAELFTAVHRSPESAGRDIADEIGLIHKPGLRSRAPILTLRTDIREDETGKRLYLVGLSTVQSGFPGVYYDPHGKDADAIASEVAHILSREAAFLDFDRAEAIGADTDFLM